MTNLLILGDSSKIKEAEWMLFLKEYIDYYFYGRTERILYQRNNDWCAE